METWQARAYAAFQIYLKRLKRAKRSFSEHLPDQAISDLRHVQAAFVNYAFYDENCLRLKEEIEEEKWQVLFAEAFRIQEALKREIEKYQVKCRDELAECVKIKARISKFKSSGEIPQPAINISI